ncbi:MAG: zinc chelation protein SecC, partial [Pseudomonadota bacterium]
MTQEPHVHGPDCNHDHEHHHHVHGPHCNHAS